MPSTGATTTGLRKSVPANCEATRMADGPDARLASNTAMALLMNTTLKNQGDHDRRQGSIRAIGRQEER